MTCPGISVEIALLTSVVDHRERDIARDIQDIDEAMDEIIHLTQVGGP